MALTPIEQPHRPSPDTGGEQCAHLVELPGQPWALWRWVGLRSAGFPVDRVLALAAPQASAAAEQLLGAEATVERMTAQATAVINQALDALRAAHAWGDLQRLTPLLRALRGLRKGGALEPAGALEDLAGPSAALAVARAALTAARDSFEHAYAADVTATARAIYNTTRDDRLCEALIWQNRRAYHTAVRTLRDPADLAHRGSQQRQHEEMIASYIQRYCVKNDTIGFFGPVGWARLTAQQPSIALRSGAELLATRRTYFEQWGIDALARSLLERYPLWPWCVPRRLPFIYLRDRTLYVPGRSSLRLGPLQAAVLRACDGERMAREIARLLLNEPGTPAGDEAQIFEVLDTFEELGLIVWTLEVPFSTYPERSLRRLLERVDDDDLRGRALAELDQLEELRAAVGAAAGDSQRLNQALHRLEERFTALTGSPATQNHGETYAARTLVYEDCRRDVEVEIGAALANELAPPLGLLLASARWLTYETARRYRVELAAIYAELAGETGLPAVDGSTFWSRVQQALLGDRRGIVAAIGRECTERWARLLNLPVDQRLVQFSVAALRPHVLAAFDAPGPGWRSALYHSPDLMISAADCDAIRRGEYELVMGELHVSSNTLRSSLFVEQHPAPRDLFEAVDRDLPDPCLVPEPPRNWHEMTSRLNTGLGRPKDTRLVFSNDSCGVPAARALPVGDLVVAEHGGQLVVRKRDGRMHIDLVECFAEMLALEIVNSFKLIPAARHTPRVRFDRLVVSWETWRFSPSELPFAFEKRDAARFLALRRWQQAHGMPRFVFVKLSIERKPFYVDFDSPVLVNIFAKSLRRAVSCGAAEEQFSVTEMLPAHNQTWLADTDGHRYTSELRFVAVDRNAVAAPGG